MQNDDPHRSASDSGATAAPAEERCGKMDDLEKQGGATTTTTTTRELGYPPDHQPTLTIVVSDGECAAANVVNLSLKEEEGSGAPTVPPPKSSDKWLSDVPSPKKNFLSRTASSDEQCRVCQQEKDENLIELGCQCRGGLAKSHRSCIEAWFRLRGSNNCEICQQAAINIPPPEPHPSTNYWIWRVDPTYRGSNVAQERERGCFSPLWVAFSILIGGLLLDVLISITLGVSALPVNIIIGVIVVLGLGTALRLALEFCHEWSLRRVVQRVDTNVNLGYHPAL